jgi:hypothetical protein
LTSASLGQDKGDGGKGDDGGVGGIFFSSSCPTDIAPPDSIFGCGDGDQVTNAADLGELLANWGACANCCADVFPPGGGDDVVNAGDLGELLANWGDCPVCGHPDAGSCFQSHDAGCNNTACCEAVCDIDGFCCSTSWDSICVGEAWDLCNPENDNCDDAFLIECGESLFGSTVNAADDTAPPDCAFTVGAPGVWYRIVGNGSDITLALCNTSTNYDSKIHVYTTGFFLFSCTDYVCVTSDDDSCTDPGLASSVTFASDYGQTYRVLVNGFGGAVGEFILSATCSGECGDAGSGSCFESNGTPFCDDAECCNAVCEIDTFCCEVTWDGICADEAGVECGNCGDPGAGDCFESNGSIGCNIEVCCTAVCNVDPFCCETTWDGVCAGEADDICATCGGAGAGSCFESHPNPACNNADCCTAVCAVDSFCCTTEWDGICANEADDICTSASTCCASQGSPGCNNSVCEACVCAIDSFCCNTSWDSVCVGEAQDECDSSCPCD